MNIDELRSVQSKERQKSDLQQLRESFYGDVADYITELEAERESVAANATDPFGSPEVQQLTNDIETAKDTAEAIYERRLGKIVKKASLVSAEMANPNDVSGLTTEEQALFSDLVDRIERNKDHMLDVIAGDVPAGSAGFDGERRPTATGSDASPSDASPGDASVVPGERGDTASTADGDTAGSGEADAGREDPPVPDDLLEGPPQADDESVSAADVMSGDATDGDGGDPTDDDGSDATDDDGGDPTDDGGGDVDGHDVRHDDGQDESAESRPGTTDPSDSPEGERTDGGATAAATDDSTGDASLEDSSAGGASASATDRATLRVTEDVGEIFGVDEREYTLSAEDVVTLPEENADVLVSQGAAERLD